MIDDSNGPEFHHVQASSMNADLEIEHQGQLGTDSALNRKSGQRSGDGNGAATRAFVLATVSAKSAAKSMPCSARHFRTSPRPHTRHS